MIKIGSEPELNKSSYNLITDKIFPDIKSSNKSQILDLSDKPNISFTFFSVISFLPILIA